MNNERQCERRTIDDGGCRLVAISHLDDSDDQKMLKVDRQTDTSLTGKRKRSLESSGLDFPRKNLSKNKKYLTFTQIFKSHIFTFLEKTLIHFLTQTKKK